MNIVIFTHNLGNSPYIIWNFEAYFSGVSEAQNAGQPVMETKRVQTVKRWKCGNRQPVR